MLERKHGRITTYAFRAGVYALHHENQGETRAKVGRDGRVIFSPSHLRPEIVLRYFLHRR